MISVVIVDDSAFMRKAIATMLEKDPEIRVIGTGRNGQEGLEKIRELKPDVVTMDIEMPVMDGLTALSRVMAEMPRPVVMISSLTTDGAEATLKAMELGALDFIPKDLSKISLDIVKIETDLQRKVKAIARRGKMSRPILPTPSLARPQTPPVPLAQRAGRTVCDVVAVGVSTGGPPAVQRVLSTFPADFPACVLIAQHMPQAFTGPFAKRLDSVCAISVKEAQGGEFIQPGTAYVAPGGRHLRVERQGARMRLQVTDEPKEALYKPSANVLLQSVAETYGRRGLGVILTGMGSDGMEGIRAMKSKGARALAQSDATCVVYGMPKAIVDAGLADEIVDIEAMGSAIINGLYAS